MQKDKVKSYLLKLGIVLLIVGIILFAVLSGSERYIGIIFLIFAIVFIASTNYLNISNSNDDRLHSRTRDQFLKHQFRK